MTNLRGSGEEPAGVASPADRPLFHERLAVEGMTCGGCVSRVERALLSVRGVSSATVDLAAGIAVVGHDPAEVTFANLNAAVEGVGYRLRQAPVSHELREISVAPARRIPLGPVVFGVIATILLSGLYIAIVGVAQGLDHAFELAITDWYFVIPIVVGFGIQVGLFVYIRSGLHLRRGNGSTTAIAGAGTGTSTVSMVACCAHHLTDVLPIVGLSGAALFLNEYRGPLMAFGILTNAIGIVLMVRMIRKSRQQS